MAKRISAKKSEHDYLKSLILTYLSRNKIATLATSYKNKPWVATIFFAFDPKFNIYFMTDLKTRKAHHILQNSQIALAINEDWGGKGTVRGLQMEGRAQLVEKNEAEEAYFLFARRHSWVKSFIHSDKDLHSKVQTNRLFKISPQKIIYQDDKLFGPGGKEELVFQ